MSEGSLVNETTAYGMLGIAISHWWSASSDRQAEDRRKPPLVGGRSSVQAIDLTSRLILFPPY
jgi:hypothetical protein